MAEGLARSAAGKGASMSDVIPSKQQCQHVWKGPDNRKHCGKCGYIEGNLPTGRGSNLETCEIHGCARTLFKSASINETVIDWGCGVCNRLWAERAEDENRKLRAEIAQLRSAVETTKPLDDVECSNCGEPKSKHAGAARVCPDAAIADIYRFVPRSQVKTGREPAFDPDVRVLSSEEVARGLTLNNIATFAYPPWHRKRYCDSGLRLMGISDTRPRDRFEAGKAGVYWNCPKCHYMNDANIRHNRCGGCGEFQQSHQSEEARHE
jgi:ribosomal protein S27AE